MPQPFLLPLIYIIFFDTRNFQKHRKSLYVFFWFCETTNFGREIVIPPPSSVLNYKFPRYQIFSETHKWFSVVWDKKNSKENVKPTLLIHSFLKLRNFLKKRKFLIWRFSALWDIKPLIGKMWYPLCMNIFDAWKIPEHRRVPWRMFSVLWDRNHSTENRGRRLLCIQFFDSGKLLKHRRFFGSVRQQILHRKSWYSLPIPPLSPPFFEMSPWKKYSATQKVFRYFVTTNFRRK